MWGLFHGPIYESFMVSPFIRMWGRTLYKKQINWFFKPRHADFLYMYVYTCVTNFVATQKNKNIKNKISLKKRCLRNVLKNKKKNSLA